MNSNDRKKKGFLAGRFRIINALFFIFILFVMTIVSAVMILRIADNASKDYVRFYTMENVDVLISHLNREISLVQYAASSKEIIEWFADEDNQEKKFAAYNKMMYFAEMQQIDGLYFAVKNSGNEYSIAKNAGFEEFIPYNVLNPEIPYDRWFFDALDSDFDYILKLDTVKSLNDYYIWIDHKVKKDGSVTGVFSSGLPFNMIFDDLYGQYDSRNVLSFIIDDKGLIQMDSSEPEADKILSSVFVYDPNEMRHIMDIKSENDFTSIVDSYLTDMTIYYSKRVQPDVYKISDKNYQYMSIAPVPNTNWLAVTMYNSRALFNYLNFLPLVIIIIFAFISYVFVSYILITRMVFKPLEQLTISVSESDHDSKNIFGIERNDEIGALAQETRDAWVRLNEKTKNLKSSVENQERQARILHAVNTMATALLSAEDDDAFKKAMPEGMQLLAECMELDRIYVFYNHVVNGSLHYILKYEWVNEFGVEGRTVLIGKDLIYDIDAPIWKELFLRGESVIGSLSNMSGEEKDLMESNGVKSVAAIPVHLHGKFWGFVSFDNCRGEHAMSQEDIDILHSASLIMASAVNRNIQTTALKAIHEYAKLMLDATPLACMLWSKDILLFDCNKKALEIFGMKDKDELGGKFHELSPEYQPDGRNSVQTMYEVLKLAVDKGSFVFEWMHQLPSGELIPSEVTLIRVNFGDEILIASYMRDLREYKKMMKEIEQRDIELTEIAEEAKAANNSKSVFLANMSHEIRTPMNSIVGFSELALDDNLQPKTRDYLNKILENSEWLLQIINDILDISKIESGKMELENIPFNLHELFAACRTVIMPKAIEKGLATHFYAEPSVGKRLYGDPTRLRQVLVNLLSNAVKFTNNGLIKMQATVTDTGQDSVTMFFEIKDSGIGITSEQIEKIFEPFIQAETGTTRKFGGSGLGLSITKNIIQMMGSTLNVESTPGVGSKFSFTVKFYAVDTDEKEILTKRIIFNDIEKPAFEGDILLCEDNSMNQQVICEHLARVGLKTEIAKNGKEGVAMIKARNAGGLKQYDLIFMDIHMPVMDGLEASSIISKMAPDIPIIAMTANIMSDDMNIYISRGMVDCVSKPFTSQELWRCLIKYLKPTTWQKEDAALREQADSELRQKLINNFVQSNRGKIKEIKDALNENDIKLAHRLVHTLKNNAGQLDKTLLQKAAEKAESCLINEENKITNSHLEVLEKELNIALTELGPLVRKEEYKIVDVLNDTEAARSIFCKLKPLLENSDIECLSCIDSLKNIPGSAGLIQHIDNFDFKNALISLAELNDKIFYE